MELRKRPIAIAMAARPLPVPTQAGSEARLLLVPKPQLRRQAIGRKGRRVQTRQRVIEGLFLFAAVGTALAFWAAAL